MTIIRAITAEHLNAAKQLFQEYAAETGIDFSFQDLNHELETLPGDYQESKGGSLLIALNEAEAIGCVALHRLQNTTCEMKRLYVKPAWKGRGLGRELARTIIREAIEMEYRVMRLDTLASMNPAVSLYRSLGFYPIDPYYHNPLPDALFLQLDLTDYRECP